MTALEYKRTGSIFFLLLFGILLGTGGCGMNTRQESRKAEEEINRSADEETERDETEIQEENAIGADESGRLYILLYTNTETKNMFLQDVDTRRQEEYQYTGGTYIKNRYGDSITVDQLQTGELVEININDKKTLKEVRIPKDTFILEGVTGITVLNEENIIQASGSNYYYDDALKIFSNESIISLNDLSSLDTVCLRGEDKKIHTIAITNGHGTVVLKNTDLFIGGMITVGNLLAKEITDNMQLELPEGTHQISAANDGYGGSKEITVNRFEELILDLDELKGDGPKSCKLKINITPEDAEVTIAGAKADCSRVLDMPYGVYSIAAASEGYTSFSGKLVVNSAEAAVTITLEKNSTSSGTSVTEKDNSKTAADGSAGSLAGSLAGSRTNDNSGNNSTGSGSKDSGTGDDAAGSGTGSGSDENSN